MVTPCGRVVQMKVMGDLPYLPMWAGMHAPAKPDAEYPCYKRNWRKDRGNGYTIPIPSNNAFRNVERWIADTGSGHDLISKDEVANKRKIDVAQQKMTFFTANGPSHTSMVCNEKLTTTGQHIAPYVMESTPAVLSIGARCMKFGYQFHWPPNGVPYFVTRDTMIIRLEVLDDIPFLNEYNPMCKPVQANSTLRSLRPSTISADPLYAGHGGLPSCPNAIGSQP